MIKIPSSWAGQALRGPVGERDTEDSEGGRERSWLQARTVAACHGFMSLRCCSRRYETADGPPVLNDCSCCGVALRGHAIVVRAIRVARGFWSSFCFVLFAATLSSPCFQCGSIWVFSCQKKRMFWAETLTSVSLQQHFTLLIQITHKTRSMHEFLQRVEGCGYRWYCHRDEKHNAFNAPDAFS